MIEGIDEISKKILIKCGLIMNNNDFPDEILILRESLLSEMVYKSVESELIELKKTLSSSSLTSLQKEANTRQKWPLLNLVRQILNVYGYIMIPIRKADGYREDGVKRFKRYFQIVKK